MADTSSWKDRIAQLRAMRNKFAKMAADKRRDAIALRKQRKWLDALQADSRAAEYRETRDRYAGDLKDARAQLTPSSQGILDNSAPALSSKERPHG